MLSASVPSQLGTSKKSMHFSRAKRHLDSVVFKILRLAHLPYVFGSKCYGLADRVDPVHTAAVQSDQGLHYLPTL